MCAGECGELGKQQRLQLEAGQEAPVSFHLTGLELLPSERRRWGVIPLRVMGSSVLLSLSGGRWLAQQLRDWKASLAVAL